MHISRQPNGKWRVIVQDEGRRRSKGGLATEREAKRIGAQLMIELGKQPKLDNATMADLIDLYLSGGERAVTTDEDYRYLVAKLPDWLLEWKVQAVTPMMLDQAYTRLTKEGWSAHRILRLHTIIRPAFALAALYDWISHSPALAVRLPTKPSSRVVAPDPVDVIRILAAADERNPAIGTALRIAATVGLRRGELCALQWDDLNVPDRQLVIRRSVSTTTADAHRVTAGKTGSKGWRVVAVPPSTMAALATHRAAQAAWLLARGIGKTDWLFTADGQHPWRTDYLTLAFSRLRDELGLDLHLHQMRHYVATQLITSGMDIRTVAGRLGHARASMTADVYSSFMPARDREAANIMERSLEG